MNRIIGLCANKDMEGATSLENWVSIDGTKLFIKESEVNDLGSQIASFINVR